MTCPLCGTELPEQTAVCPYCNAQTQMDAETVNAIKNIYSVDTALLRKKHRHSFLLMTLWCIGLAVLAVLVQMREPSISVQLRRSSPAEIAEVCASHPAETAEDQYTQALTDAIADLQKEYAANADSCDNVIASLQKIACTQNLLAREQACDAATEIASERLLQEINRVRNQRQRQVLMKDDVLTDAAQLLADTYQESPDTYETEAKRIVQDLVPEADTVYHIILMHCETYANAVGQYNSGESEVSMNFLTTKNYTKIGISSVYDPALQQFHFILLLQ